MSWFLFALIATLGWGFADLYYKKGTDENDNCSHLKIAVWVGLVMGITSCILLPLGESGQSFSDIISNAVKYTPASLCYIISMVIGYAGLRYLEISIISPIQNASGAFALIAMTVYFMVTGTMSSFSEEFAVLDVIGTILIIIGVLALAIVEKKINDGISSDGKTQGRSLLCLLFPIMYCIFDTIGTAADGVILDEDTGLGLGEIDVLILYGFTFLLCGIIAYIIIVMKTKKLYNPFRGNEIKYKGSAACFEQFGQIFYVYAMAAKPLIAAPMISSYCIVSVILGRLVIGERLGKARNICVITVIAGIVILGISEGLA